MAFLTACGKPFFKSVLSRDVAPGVKRTRHQLAPAVPGQKITDRALAGFVPDGLFVGCLEIVDVQHFAGSSDLGKTCQQGLFLLQRHVLALASAAWSRLECLDAAVVIGHVRSPCSATRPFLPPYSPELNPKENLWEEIREKIFKNYALKSIDAVRAKLEEAILYIERNPETVKSITSFPYIRKSS